MAVDLNNLSTKTLVELFNLVSDKPTKKFESKEAGIKRLTKALADANSEVFDAGNSEYDVRMIITDTDDEGKPGFIDADGMLVVIEPVTSPAIDDELTMLKFKGNENLIKESDLKPIPAEPAKKTNKRDRSAASREVGRQSPLLGKTLTLVRAANPKRLKSRTAVRYEIYRVVKTSDEFVRICEEQGLGTRREILSDLAYDSKQEFIKLTQSEA